MCGVLNGSPHLLDSMRQILQLKLTPFKVWCSRRQRGGVNRLSVKSPWAGCHLHKRAARVCAFRSMYRRSRAHFRASRSVVIVEKPLLTLRCYPGFTTSDLAVFPKQTSIPQAPQHTHTHTHSPVELFCCTWRVLIRYRCIDAKRSALSGPQSGHLASLFNPHHTGRMHPSLEQNNTAEHLKHLLHFCVR